MERLNRLGILGGTFDPPHLGHIALARAAAEQLKLDRVLWVITPDPPHKRGQPVSLLAERMDLLESALRNQAGFEISRVDVDRPGPQYAVDTVRLIREANPASEVVYIVGGDSLRDLPTWRDPAGLIAQVDTLAVLRRPEIEVDLDRLEKVIPGLKEKVTFLDAPLMNIASRTIREWIRAGRDLRGVLPEAVAARIEEMNYYR